MSTPFPTRVGQLVRLMLSTDRPGEAVAAADAIRRTLASAGLDLYALGDAIEAGLRVPLVPDDGGEDWRSIARFCRRHSDELTEKEADFVATLLTYYEPPSPKQMKWLVDIRDRIDRGRR
jgi:hypothetical protein